MEVILLNDVEKVGLRGEVVDVARGYARNFLLPRRLAEVATPAKVAEVRRREELRARHEAKSVEQAQEIADTLRKTVLRFDVTAGPTGRLFGSVTPTDIADELWRTRKIRIDRRRIGIDTIKRIGRYEVPVQVFQDVDVEIKTLVVPEGGELPPDEELEAMEAAERGEEAAAQDAQSEGLEELEAELAAEEEPAAAAEPATAAEPAADAEPESAGETEAQVEVAAAEPEDTSDPAEGDYERPPDDYRAES
jgi:large subunit ribosomal protein L9